jgi:hypothetical protein
VALNWSRLSEQKFRSISGASAGLGLRAACARRQSWTRRLCGDPRNDSKHGYGRYRPRCVDEPRARHRLGAFGQGFDGDASKIPYEVRDEKEYFDEIQDVKVTKDKPLGLNIAAHVFDRG